MVTDPIRTLLVDDERLARRGLRALLADEPDVAIVGECGNGAEALTTVRAEPVDLVFLDVRMPLVDGFAFVDAVPVETRPVVVFVTAYRQHAGRAFDVHALDYVLKPFESDRVRQAVSRARELIGLRRTRAERLPPAMGQRTTLTPRIAVRSADGVRLIAEEQIDWIEAAGYYAKLRVGREGLLVRDSLDALEQRLDPNRFIRVHRSAIVNVERIVAIQPYAHGRCVLLLGDGTRLVLSRSRRAAVARALRVAL